MRNFLKVGLVLLPNSVLFTLILEGGIERTVALLLVHLGLFLNITASLIVYGLNEERASPVSRSLFGCFLLFLPVAYFQFGLRAGLAAGGAAVVYYLLGSWLTLRLLARLSKQRDEGQGPGGEQSK
jgi:hypothetical protein